MAAHEPLPQTLDADDASQAWTDALAAVSRRGERVAIQEDGVTVAALVSVHDLERLARLDAERNARFAVFERISAAFAHEDPEESDRLSALALAEAREAKRRERAAKSEA